MQSVRFAPNLSRILSRNRIINSISFHSPILSTSIPSPLYHYQQRCTITSFLSLSSDNLKHSHRERRLIKYVYELHK